MDNKVFIDLITKNHGTDVLSGTSYLIIIYDQDLNRITEQYPSTKDTLTEALEEYLEDELLPEEFEYVHLDVNANLQPIIILVK